MRNRITEALETWVGGTGNARGNKSFNCQGCRYTGLAKVGEKGIAMAMEVTVGGGGR